MNSSAAMQMAMPESILGVRTSLNIMVPMRMDVIGSNTPSTAVRVGPIILVERARVSMEIMVGKMARPMRFTTEAAELQPCRKGAFSGMLVSRKRTLPVARA